MLQTVFLVKHQLVSRCLGFEVGIEHARVTVAERFTVASATTLQGNGSDRKGCPCEAMEDSQNSKRMKSKGDLPTLLVTHHET